MPTVAVDWDDTLVGYKKHPPNEWLPGAVQALHWMHKKRFKVVIYSCRANWPEGLAEIQAKLAEVGLAEAGWLSVRAGKPVAFAYVDDRSVPFRGDWNEVLPDIYALKPKQ